MNTDALRARHRKERIAAAAIVFVVAAIAAAIGLYNRREAARDSGLFIPKSHRVTRELSLLQEYIRIDTSNPPGNETSGARWLAARLRAEGITAEVIEPMPGRGSVYARIRGRRPKEGLLLVHHIDVVPATGEGWTRPPFSGSAHLNAVYGRGSLDMKGIGITHLAAFVALAHSGRLPERDVVFLGTADEETGGKLGMKWLVTNRPDIFEGIRFALNEGGITETVREKLSYFGIEIGSRQIFSLDLAASSVDSLQRARIALEPYIVSREPGHVSSQVRQFLKELAPVRQAPSSLLSDIDRAIAEGKFWYLPQPYRELMQNNVWPTGIVPQGSEFRMRTRMINLTEEQPAARIQWLAQFVAPYGVRVAEVLESDGPVPFSSDRTVMFALLRDEIRKTYGEVPVGTEILSLVRNDSRFLRMRGIDSYGIWPFPVDFYETLGIHGVDERVRIDWFQRGVELMGRVVSRYAFATSPIG